jgi:hypothetical protein
VCEAGRLLVAEEGLFSKKTWLGGCLVSSLGLVSSWGPVARLGEKSAARWTEEACGDRLKWWMMKKKTISFVGFNPPNSFNFWANSILNFPPAN